MTKVKIQGYPAQREGGLSNDEFAFYGDGTFEMIDLGGVWAQDGKKYIVTLNAEQLEAFYEALLAESGLDVDVEVARLTLFGKESVLDTEIRGKLYVVLDCYFYDLLASGTIKAKFNFVGSRALSRPVGEGEAATRSPSDTDAIEGMLKRLVPPSLLER